MGIALVPSLHTAGEGAALSAIGIAEVARFTAANDAIAATRGPAAIAAAGTRTRIRVAVIAGFELGAPLTVTARGAQTRARAVGIAAPTGVDKTIVAHLQLNAAFAIPAGRAIARAGTICVAAATAVTKAVVACFDFGTHLMVAAKRAGATRGTVGVAAATRIGETVVTILAGLLDAIASNRVSDDEIRGHRAPVAERAGVQAFAVGEAKATTRGQHQRCGVQELSPMRTDHLLTPPFAPCPQPKPSRNSGRERVASSFLIVTKWPAQPTPRL